MQRISYNEALELFKKAPLSFLKQEAKKLRNEKNPPNRVTFVLDTNPNYTNICNADCSFCAFYRKKKAKDAYSKSIEDVMKDMEFARKAGITTVLLQGGLNDDLPLQYYVDLVKTARKRYPEINPHFFTAPEIWNIARLENITMEEVLQALFNAGQRSIPGGGAEIISERVRQKISPKKMAPNVWIDMHKAAHKIGFRTTATMMYGHIEEPEDIVEHLDHLRRLQDETGGFTAFIPWSYKRDNTALRRKVKHWAGKDAYFRILAFSRIYLDNFDHIQASWFSEGKETGIQALHYGADDFGGTILQENVHREANFINKTHHQGMLDMIRKAGFEPAQRDTFYCILRTYEGIDKIEMSETMSNLPKDHTPILEQVQTQPLS